jgi:hypothetical protein
MHKRPKSVVNAQPGGRKAIIVTDFDEDGRGRRKKSKPTAQNRPTVNLMVDSDHRFNGRNLVDVMQTEAVPAEPEYVGLEMGDDDFGLADEAELGPGKKKVSGVSPLFMENMFLTLCFCNIRLQTIYCKIGWTTGAISILQLSFNFTPHQQPSNVTVVASAIWSYIAAPIVSAASISAPSACSRGMNLCQPIGFLTGMDISGKTIRCNSLVW